jgi:predicted NAD/FAD-dependent oxidoreductase
VSEGDDVGETDGDVVGTSETVGLNVVGDAVVGETVDGALVGGLVVGYEVGIALS